MNSASKAIAILIGAGTINGLMYVVSLFFQDPAGLGMTPLQAGLATLPATIGLVAIAPFISRIAVRIGSRQVVALGFAITTAGFAAIVLVTGSWGYGMFVLPLVAIAVGMGFSNGAASASATASVPQSEVGAASGISNMARYVGAALMTAAAATIYGAATADGQAPDTGKLVDGLSRASLLMTIASAAGIAVALLYGRHRPARPQRVDDAAAAAVSVHTMPGSAAHGPPQPRVQPGALGAGR